MPEESKEIKVKFKDCIRIEVATLNFVGEDDAEIGSVTLIPLLRKTLLDLIKSDNDEGLAVASIKDWTFKDQEGNLLPRTTLGFVRLHPDIQAEIFKKIRELNFVSEIEEKN